MISERTSTANCLTFDTEAALCLLQRMLSLVRRSRETPLQFEIDSERIAAVALDEFGASSLFEDTRLTRNLGILNGLIHQIPGGEGEPLKSDLRNTSSRSQCDQGRVGMHSVAAWLEHLYGVAREIHPQAIDMLALRLQGFDARDIAQHLDLGRRLVQRVLSDMQAGWAQAAVN
jgi:hypothetical protein